MFQCVVFISDYSLVSTALSAGTVQSARTESTAELRPYPGNWLVISASFGDSVSGSDKLAMWLGLEFWHHGKGIVRRV
jgi:hypothetical protein